LSPAHRAGRSPSLSPPRPGQVYLQTLKKLNWTSDPKLRPQPEGVRLGAFVPQNVLPRSSVQYSTSSKMAKGTQLLARCASGEQDPVQGDERLQFSVNTSCKEMPRQTEQGHLRIFLIRCMSEIKKIKCNHRKSR
jgi:hypothetical protein